MHDVEADSGHSSNDERLKECLWLWPLHQQRLRDGLRASGWEQAREGIALHSVEPGFLESVLQGISHHYGLDSTDYARWTQREWQQILDQGPLRVSLSVG